MSSGKWRSVFPPISRPGIPFWRLYRTALLLRPGKLTLAIVARIHSTVYFVFFQAVGCALNVLGFGESIAGLVGLTSAWAQRGFAAAAVILLSVINLAGVKWVIKLQFVLLLILLLAGLDFIVGSFAHTNVGEIEEYISLLKIDTQTKIPDPWSLIYLYRVWFRRLALGQFG